MEYKIKPFKKFQGKDKKREEIEKKLNRKLTDKEWRDYQMMVNKGKQ